MAAVVGDLAAEADSCISQPEVVAIGGEAQVAAAADSVDLGAEVLVAVAPEGIGDKQQCRRKEGRGTIKEYFVPCPSPLVPCIQPNPIS